MEQEELEETTPAPPTETEPTPEPTEPAESGITLPDDAAAVEELAATDRLLAFDADGNPTTATAEQVKEFTNIGMASLIPFSLEEQAVPGEFWDGRQVYVRSFIIEGAWGDNGFISSDGFQTIDIPIAAGVSSVVQYTGSINYRDVSFSSALPTSVMPSSDLRKYSIRSEIWCDKNYLNVTIGRTYPRPNIWSIDSYKIVTTIKYVR